MSPHLLSTGGVTSYQLDAASNANIFTPNKIYFKLMGEMHSFSVTGFNPLCGFIDIDDIYSPGYDSGCCDYPFDFHKYLVCYEFSCDA